MIFKPELVEKILAGEKSVTRRPVKSYWDETYEAVALSPCRYQAGKDYALQPGRGKKAVARIRILDVRRQRLGHGADCGRAEARREGFSNWVEFHDYWIGLYGSYDPSQLVDRIEFELLPDTRNQPGADAPTKGASE